MISQEEVLRRKEAVQFAIDNNRLEGLEPSEQFIKIANEWSKGLLTDEEFGSKVYEIHGLRSLS